MCALEVPRIITDCKGLVDTVAAGPLAATAPSRILARIWNTVVASVDGNLNNLATALGWMPAHQTLTMVGSVVPANGKVLTIVHWRANRLADAIAKAFARDHLAAKQVVSLVASSRKAVAHHAA